MKTSNKKTATKRKQKTQMEEVDLELDQADFSDVTIKHVVKMAEIHETREKRGRPSVGKRRSIILPDDLIERIKKVADKLNIGGYQPLIRLILSEKLAEYEKRAKKQ
jgi:hypothetical protein